MKSFILICMLAFATLICTDKLVAQLIALPRSTPEAQGVSSAGIREFIETADREVNSLHSFILVRHGQVVVEAWWLPEDGAPHRCSRTWTGWLRRPGAA